MCERQDDEDAAYLAAWLQLCYDMHKVYRGRQGNGVRYCAQQCRVELAKARRVILQGERICDMAGHDPPREETPSLDSDSDSGSMSWPRMAMPPPSHRQPPRPPAPLPPPLCLVPSPCPTPCCPAQQTPRARLLAKAVMAMQAPWAPWPDLYPHPPWPTPPGTPATPLQAPHCYRYRCYHMGGFGVVSTGRRGEGGGHGRIANGRGGGLGGGCMAFGPQWGTWRGPQWELYAKG